jgi:choline-sulfatase
VDENIGRILDQLGKAGGLDDTLVVYTSDHGEMLGTHGLWLKNVLLEGAAHVPLLLAGAGLPLGKNR